MLQDTGAAGAPKSYFFEDDVADWARLYGGGPVSQPSKPDEIGRVFAAVRGAAEATSDIAGVRQQAPSLVSLCDALARWLPGLPNDRTRIEAAFGRTHFIHLTRQDKLAQAVSYIRAQQSGLWHRHADGSELERLSAETDPVYDAAAIAAQIAEFEAFEQVWSNWFDCNGIDPLLLTYEDLAASPSQVLRQVLAFLELDERRAETVSPSVEPLSDAVNADWMARFKRDQRPK